MGGITLFCAEEPREMSTRYMQRRISHRERRVLRSTRNAACRIAYREQCVLGRVGLGRTWFKLTRVKESREQAQAFSIGRIPHTLTFWFPKDGMAKSVYRLVQI